jgi:hypothetical protein
MMLTNQQSLTPGRSGGRGHLELMRVTSLPALKGAMLPYGSEASLR